MTTLELIEYYAGLLILQYVGLPRAFDTIKTRVRPIVMPQTPVQLLTFSGIPVSGDYALAFGDDAELTFAWNETAAAIQTAIQGSGDAELTAVTVTGDTTGGFTFTLTGVEPGTNLFALGNTNTLLDNASAAIALDIEETDLTLPLAVQNAFNLIGPNPAQGVQLDILGKYIGVSRNGNSFSGPVTLDDTDYLILLKIKILQNSLGSDLATIQQFLYNNFGGDIRVFDYADMTMDYFFDTGLGSNILLEVFIQDGLLPKPMGVGLRALIYAPIDSAFFGFSTYDYLGYNVSPFNTYDSYSTTSPWLTYDNTIQNFPSNPAALALDGGGLLLQEDGGEILL